MSRLPPDFDLQNIRPHRGSQYHGFEELCTQLLSLEPRPPSAVFYRKGGSADGGVEAYIEFDNGNEHCLQAKFYRQFTADLANKLTASLKQALDKHPGLVKYIVCVPFNLRDAQDGAKATELDRWKAWTEKAQAEAQRRSRKLSIELWDASTIHTKLTTNDGRYAGRLRYWLDKEVFSDAWFSKRWQEAKAVLGGRYLPRYHVPTPARELIDALVRAPGFADKLERLTGQALEAAESVRSSLRGALKANAATTPPAADYLSPVVELCGQLKPNEVGIEGTYDVESWRSAAEVARKSVANLVAWGREAATKSDDEHWRSLFHFTYRLFDVLADVQEELAGDKWDAANKKALFLSGPGGSGKSHLLGDAVQSVLDGKRPAVLVPNSALTVSPVGWSSVAERLGRGAALSIDELLGALDAAGQAADTRALLAIDAINEGPARHWWPEQLGEFLVEAHRYPFVAVVLTCRDTSVNRMIGPNADSILEPRLARATVEGFADATGELARHYLAMRGVTGWLGRPGPESTNPLFLRACCDAVIAAGGNELPKGLDGITAMFSFYRTAVARSVENRLGAMPKLRIVERFLASFGEMVAASADRYVLYEDAYALAEKVFASGGLSESNLLAALEAEGVLAVEPGVGGDPDRDYVRFTFERMSDHEIASAILRQHFERHTLADAFDAITPLGAALRNTDWELESVIQALAIQIAEEHGVELGDIVPATYAPGVWGGRENFLDTVHWRSPQSVTARTLHWIEDAIDADGLAGFYIEFGPQVGNAFNADWLHQRLVSQTMPERDVEWTATVSRLGFEDGEAIQSVVDWALSAGRRIADPTRLELLATTLTWLLTTSHREVRDKATKALASVLAGSASASLKLLKKFSAVDDGYLQERLYAAVYGAALQASWPKSEYASLATYVLREFFGGASVPRHILTRDYARGIVETALRMGAINEAQATAARPPYRSAWSIDLVPDEALAAFVWPAGSDINDDVVSSCLHDDFEHYTIPHAIGSFGCSPRADASTISSNQLAIQWLEHFDSWAGPQARIALKSLLEARRDVVMSSDDWARRRKLEEVAKAALDRFKSEVGPLVAENLRVCAFRGDLLVPGNDYADGRAHFDRLWVAKWVARRAHDLGWSAEAFEAAEGSFRPTRDRMDHRIERLGKKYQWLALHDLAGRLSDAVQYLPGSSEDKPRPYEGPWQISVRDIDPSMLRRSTKDDGWKSWSPTWWLPRQAKLTCRTPMEALHWLTSEVDIVNDEGLIDLTDSEGRRWLSLHGAGSWNRSGKHRHPHEVTRKSWVHLHCLVVGAAEEAKLVSALTKSKAASHPELPDGSGYSEAFLGEYGWHPSTRGFDEWHNSDGWGQRLPRILVPTIEYHHEKGYDYSADGSVSFRMPGAWLSAGLGLRLSNGADLTWTSDGKRTVFFDPAVSQDGPSAALVDRDAFVTLLERKGLRAVWVLYGEKELYGPDPGGDAFGGRLHHISVYRLQGGHWEIDKHRFHLKPSSGQLEAFIKCC